MPATRPPRAAPVASADADSAPPLLRLLDAAEEAGELDVRQVAQAVGMETAGLRAALADPATLDRAQRDALGAALGLDRARLRALLGGPPRADLSRAHAPTADAPRTDGPAGATPAHDAPAVAPETSAMSETSEAAAPPRSTAELLERAVLAVDDGAPWGRAARLALLDAAERRAAEAGRTVPRELHALRARVRDGRTPTRPAERGVESGAASAPDADVPRPRRGALAPDAERAVDEAARTVGVLQAAGAGWDDLFAPVHDDVLAALLRRFTLAVHEAPLGATAAAVVSPPLYGRGVVVLSAQAGAEQRRVALRVALAHAAAGHVREERPLPFPAPPHEARVAALVALADLVPFWQLAHGRRRARLGWTRIADDVARQGAALAGDWPRAWTTEVAALRVALYRGTGL
jgi:hypothetical protein